MQVLKNHLVIEFPEGPGPWPTHMIKFWVGDQILGDVVSLRIDAMPGHSEVVTCTLVLHADIRKCAGKSQQ